MSIVAEPIFIGGMFKSGTSLLRAMLGRHSGIYSGLETQWMYIQPETALAEWLPRMAEFHNVAVSELAEVLQSAPASGEAMLDTLMAYMTRLHDKRRWAEKTPENIAHIGRILEHWPNAKIVHILRDPRDVYTSLLEIDKWTEPAEFVRRWSAVLMPWAEWMSQPGRPQDRYYQLRYEQLVREPRAVVGPLLDFLGEPFEAEVAEFSGQRQDFDVVERVTGKQSSTLKRLANPIGDDRVGLWQRRPGFDALWSEVEAEFRRLGHWAVVEGILRETDALEAAR